MLNADRAVKMDTCPRCGIGGFERLKSHSYCVDCNYSETPEQEGIMAMPDWAVPLFKNVTKKKKKEAKCGLVLALAL